MDPIPGGYIQVDRTHLVGLIRRDTRTLVGEDPDVGYGDKDVVFVSCSVSLHTFFT